MSSAHTAGGNGSSYSARSGLSKSWKTVKAHSGVYTGGKVEIFQQKDGGASLIACMLNDDVAILDAATGELKRTLQQDVEDVRALTILAFYRTVCVFVANPLACVWY